MKNKKLLKQIAIILIVCLIASCSGSENAETESWLSSTVAQMKVWHLILTIMACNLISK